MKKLVASFLRYLFYWGFYVFGKIFSKILNQIKVSGKEHIPKKDVFCLFADHKTIADPWWILLATVNFFRMFVYQKRIPVSAADSKNFFSRPFKRHFFKLMKCISVSRNSHSITLMEKQVDQYLEVLEEWKQNLLIFFTGTRSRDGEIGKCKYGPAKLVIKAPHIKYIPVFLDKGIEKIMPIKEGKIFSMLSFFHKGHIIFGPAINFSDILEKEIEEIEKIKLIQEKIRQSVLALKP